MAISIEYIKLPTYSLSGCPRRETTSYTTSEISRVEKSVTPTARRPKPTSISFTNRSGSYVVRRKGTFIYHVKGSSLCQSVMQPTYSRSLKTFDPIASTISGAFPDIRVKLRKELEDDVLNLGGYIGEFKETLNMFHSLGTLFNTWYHAVLSGSKPHPAAWSDLWLGNQFMIQPLISDITDLINILSSSGPLNGLKWKKHVVTGYNREVKDYEDSLYTSNTHQTLSRRVILYTRRNPNFSYISLGNPAEWIWEGIPFSFLIDWFLPIGDWINSWDALSGYEEIIGCTIDRTVIEAQTHKKPIVTTSSSSIESVPAAYHAKSFTRVNTVDLSMGGISVKNPFASLSHKITAVALLNGFFHSKRASINF